MIHQVCLSILPIYVLKLIDTRGGYPHSSRDFNLKEAEAQRSLCALCTVTPWTWSLAS